MYSHISRDERAVIADGLRHDESYAHIAGRIDRNKGAVWREVKRNGGRRGYRAGKADRRAVRVRAQSKTGSRLVERDTALATRLSGSLEPLVSPEVVAKEEGIFANAVYAWIYRSRRDLLPSLPQRGRKRRIYGSKRSKNKGWTANVRQISERPAGADNRSRVGHFEGDTIRGRNGALLAHTDRKSRFEVARLVPDEGADASFVALTGDRHLVSAKSFTYDRGSTFALWRMVEEATGAKVYFAGPYRPWKRGTNENANGRLRRVFPKGTDFGTITQKDVDRAVWTMNHTPRKCLNWRTPCMVYGKCCTSA